MSSIEEIPAGPSAPAPASAHHTTAPEFTPEHNPLYISPVPPTEPDVPIPEGDHHHGSTLTLLKGKVEHVLGSVLHNEELKAKGIALEEKAKTHEAHGKEPESKHHHPEVIGTGGASNLGEISGTGFGVIGAGGAGSASRPL